MRYRKLGSSDLEVSEISLGSWLTYSGGIEAEQTRACTDAAFDAGINFFDTANVYGRGAAESAWGEILSRRPRDSYILATKVWGQMSDDPEDRGLSAAQIAKQIDASLQRLQTDHVDLYQAHRFDPDVPIEETIEALQRVVAEGKARYLGFSEWTAEQIEAAIEIAGPDLFVSSQPQYSMLWRAPEAELFPLCEANGISQIVWSPLAQGVLTGKYAPGQPPPEGSRAASDAMGSFIAAFMNDRVLEAGGRAPAGRRGRGPDRHGAGTRVGAAARGGRLGDRRSLATGAGPRQRGRLRSRAERRGPRGDRRRARRRADNGSDARPVGEGRRDASRLRTSPGPIHSQRSGWSRPSPSVAFDTRRIQPRTKEAHQMSLPLAVAFVVVADLLVIAAVAFVMTRARLLTPHGPAVAAAAPPLPGPLPQERRSPTPAGMALPARA